MKSKTEKLTVLMVASSYPRFEGDTAGIFLKYLAQHVASAGVKVHVLAPDDSSVRSDADVSEVDVHHFPYFPRCQHMLAYGAGILPNIRRKPLVALQVPFFLVSMFISLLVKSRALRPGVIHAHWIIPAGLVAVVVGKLMNIPVVVTVHGSDAFGMSGRAARFLKRYVIRNSQVWTANTIETAGAATELEKEYANKLTIIPMGVDCDLFASGDIKQISITDEESKVLLFVGRVIESKGVRYLIEALALLKRNGHSGIELWLIGDGTGTEAMRRLASTLGIESSVRFIGSINHEELRHYYAAATIFVMPSLSEGQCVVVIEAMAAGVPVIASRVGGIVSVIKDRETGYLVEPGDSLGLSAMIEKCLDDKNLVKVAENAKRIVLEKYDWVAIADQFKILYQNIVLAPAKSS